MHKIVISDTSCFVVLDKIKKLDLLNSLYSEVITTPEIVHEFGQPLPRWVSVRSTKNKEVQHNLELSLDLGEASAIALSLEIKNCIIILDDLKARKIADDLKLQFTGTLGILVKAKKAGLIESVKPLISDLQKAGLRFSEEVAKDVLSQASER